MDALVYRSAPVGELLLFRVFRIPKKQALFLLALIYKRKLLCQNNYNGNHSVVIAYIIRLGGSGVAAS